MGVSAASCNACLAALLMVTVSEVRLVVLAELDGDVVALEACAEVFAADWGALAAGGVCTEDALGGVKVFRDIEDNM